MTKAGKTSAHAVSARARTPPRSGPPRWGSPRSAPAPLVPLGALTVVYDDHCALCRQAHDWLQRQATIVPLRFSACSSQQAQQRYGRLPWVGDQLMVVADDGRVWAGPPAFVMCLWATRNYRWLGNQLAAPHAWPLAARLFAALSNKRHRIAALFNQTHPCADGACDAHPPKKRGPYR